jgi:hypothetical protein
MKTVSDSQEHANIGRLYTIEQLKSKLRKDGRL